MEKKEVGFNSRSSRPSFIMGRLGGYFKPAKSVLDVGCAGGDLARQLSPDVRYAGIEVDPRGLSMARCLAEVRPQTRILDFNVESGPLPFEDNAFDVVNCIEVLEHLEKLHFVFQELVRVSRRYVVISLPNMYWLPFRLEILRGRGAVGGDLSTAMKFYGLPPALPRDRHRWFFSYEQAQDFVRGQKNCRVAEEFGYFGEGDGSVKSRLKDVFVRRRGRWPNLFAVSYWAVLEKTS